MGYLDTKEHKEWRKGIIEKFGNKCMICDVNHHINAHHLIPKNIIEFRSHPMNGVPLCFKHHTKYGCGLSPHSHGSMLFFLWLVKYRPDILKWIEENYEI